MGRKKRRKKTYYWNNIWRKPSSLTHKELLEQLDPLLVQFKRVDEIVVKVAQGEGHVADLVDLERILKEPIQMPCSQGKPIILAQPTTVWSELSSLSRDLHLEIHSIKGQYPCYLLCRVSTGWDTPDTVLEQLYVSSQNDFFPDKRFTILLRNGRSRTFLYLSPFREKLKEHLAKAWTEIPDEDECDEILETIAKLVLAAAWYEDQRLPFFVADIFELKHFRSALELVAFVLGSDLYQVASEIQDGNKIVIDFFNHIYENLPLARLLEWLNCHGAGNSSDLESAARKDFAELNRAFSTFLSSTDMLCDLEE
ncbi:unnamed protein product, partial [marine sediment metagenome]